MSKEKFPMTDKKYVAKKGSVCPFCGSDQIVGDSVDTGDGQALQEMSCSDCDKSWTDVYKLVGYNPTGC